MDPSTPEESATVSRSGRVRHLASRLLGPEGERGQVLPLFVIMTVVLLGGAALLTDVAWWWANEQRMQRAADAGALAGAIYLPGDQSMAFSTALAETAKNGYVNGVDGIAITPRRDPGDPRKLLVDVDGPVGTNFARVFCWDGGPCLDGVPVSVTGAATYVLPVPMGSPQNYYGVGYLVDSVTTTTPATDSTGWRSPTAVVMGGQWSNASNAFSSGYTTEQTDGDRQEWGNFDLLSDIPDTAGTGITGLRLRLEDAAHIGSSLPHDDCRVSARLSWDGGSSWSSPVPSAPLGSSDADFTLGSASDTTAWGSHVWTRSDLSDSSFQVRLVWHDGVPGCTSSRNVRVGELDVDVSYVYDQTSTSIETVDVTSPTGAALAPQNFWGVQQSQGASKVDGDAFSAYYHTRTSTANDEYDPDGFYHYGVEIPAGASNGEIWVFDAGFCESGWSTGTGENWIRGGNGSSQRRPMSNFYDLYDTRNTPYNLTDDVLVATSGNTFRRLFLSDHSLGQTAATDCSAETWHNDWWRIGVNLSGNKTYRLHTYTTDPGSDTDQRDTTAFNAFAIWSTATGGTPRVFGLGAMEAYVRLPANTSSEFYLAQIDKEHAGKTMVIKLWDPGDTNDLRADLQILEPTGSSYQATRFSYSAERGTDRAVACEGRTGTDVTSMRTNNGGSGYTTGLFNGCWVTIEIPLPSDYVAPHPATDSVTDEGGWWKIRYIMSGGASGSTTFDLTTWQVTLRGNPVHLVLE